MNSYDEKQPEEQDPQYEELMILLQNVKLDPRLVDPQERARILAQARTRLFQTNPESFKSEQRAAPALRERGSFPSGRTALASKPQYGRRSFGSRLPHVFNILAAVLVVAVLLGGSLLLFQHRHPSTRNHVTIGSGSYASFVAKNGIMFGFDAQHTHFNPYEHMLNPTTVKDLSKKWVFDFGGSVISSPTVAGGVVYIGCVCGYLYALDAATGAKKWAYPTGSSQIGDVPAVVDGVVYFGTVESHTLYALDAATGTKKWDYQTRGAILSPPTVIGGMVYVGSDDNTLYALDAATGAEKWTYWTRGSIESSPAVVGSMVYVGSFDGNVYAFDAATGAKQWAFRTGNNVYNSLAVAGGVVYVGAGDGNVYALDAATGAKKWIFQIGGPLGPSISSPAIAGGVIYIASRGNVYALNAATGAKQWMTSIQASTDPEVAGGLVYFGSGDGHVYALDAVTGAKKGAIRGDESTIDCSPVVADGVVYYGSLSSPLYAFHLPGT